MHPEAPTVAGRFDDALAGAALVFPPPDRLLTARTSAEVPGLLAELDRATRDGAWAFGFLCYEAAAGLDPVLTVAASPGSAVPLAWFAIGGPPRTEPVVPAPPGRRRYWTSPWQLDATPGQHAAAVRQVQREIADGTIYQANLTCRARATVRGELVDLYADLVHAQRGSYNALVDVGDFAVISASPELFFDWTPPGLRCRPMKGTARRGSTPDEDDRSGRSLSASAKDIAENIMIVDLVRNDLGRIARTGSVSVPRLCVREPFGAVWQLSSDVVCEPRAQTGLRDVLTALFPSGSITGAPKAAAMQVLRDLEPTPRGVYCGAVGWVAPPGSATRARFNVAIRTLVVERGTGAATYGTGGGITVDSEPAAEYQEMLDKLAVLAAVRDPDELQLLETLAFTRPAGFRHLERHLDRLATSAAYFGIRYDEHAARRALHRAVDGQARARVRLQLHADGRLEVTTADLPHAPRQPVRVALDTCPVDADSLWQRHKTNRRDAYDAARGRHPGADDVVMTNQRGEITETTVANVAVRLDGRWWTPPLGSGCLPGIGRAVALENGTLAERVITAAELRDCDAIALISSLRGRRRASLVAAQPTAGYSTPKAEDGGGDD